MYTALIRVYQRNCRGPAAADEPEETLTHQHVQLFSEQHPLVETTPPGREDHDGDEPAQSVDAHHPTATEIHLTLFSDR
ncbi:hypothetical protein [Rhodococcus tibetensis]|uniref:Uncharacterized protein n=1 Tax=Rhodococcus tibetensis TaxID=2965064 RepID=A0ABT1Q963_9NOCA|nr:hypothetical protein [Rhodococcus sp. FXJ9.536]MCQ4118787.1 hypothetical protein [Rhodococcus sp. FXJ9.536]